VILHDPVSDQTMPVWVGTAEGEAIARSLFGVKSPRPMTHDLLADMVKAMEATVEEVLVNDSRDGVYYGRVHIRTRQEALVDIDSRPSDAVALALRTGAPIRVTRRLLDEAPEIQIAPDGKSPDFSRALGLTVVSASDEIRKMFELPKRDGVVVVESRDEAAQAGVRRGDLILEVNGKKPKDAQAFWEAVRSARIGETVELRYWRDGKEHTVRVTRQRPQPVPSPAVPA
jgi:bifunctional DNase/RNase